MYWELPPSGYQNVGLTSHMNDDESASYFVSLVESDVIISPLSYIPKIYKFLKSDDLLNKSSACAYDTGGSSVKLLDRICFKYTIKRLKGYVRRMEIKFRKLAIYSPVIALCRYVFEI